LHVVLEAGRQQSVAHRPRIISRPRALVVFAADIPDRRWGKLMGRLVQDLAESEMREDVCAGAAYMHVEPVEEGLKRGESGLEGNDRDAEERGEEGEIQGEERAEDEEDPGGETVAFVVDDFCDGALVGRAKEEDGYREDDVADDRLRKPPW